MSTPALVDVLAVDDTPANLQSLEALLKDVGCRVVTAKSGDEALRLLLQHEFALILLDIQMPNLDGFETAQLIRARERTKHIPIIFLTAYNRTEAAVTRGYSLGAVDFLFKPLVPEILKAKVQVFLDLYRKTQQTRAQAELLRQAEAREHTRKLGEAQQKFQQQLLKEEAERERRVREALGAKAEELTRLVQEKERAEVLIRQSNARLTLLAEIANRLLLGNDVAERLTELYEQLCRHLGLTHFFEHRASTTTPTCTVGAHSPMPEWQVRGLEDPHPEAPWHESIRTRRTVSIPDAQASAAFAGLRELGLRSFVSHPITVGGTVHGALTLAGKQPRELDADELSVLRGVCDQVAAWRERSRLIEELREADRRKNEFLAMLAHELRNPLAPVNNALEVLRFRNTEDTLMQRTLAAADRQVRHMSRLIDDLLDVSRITRGKIELRKTRIELATVVDQAVHACESIVQQRQHTLEVSLPVTPVPLDADATRLTQVVANLLQNAAKYTDPGGRIRLEAKVETEAQEVVLRVTDNGSGIRHEMLDKIFDLFVQVDPTSDRASGGLGLGLTLVRSLVELHGGQVTCVSAGAGQGSEFTVRLPLAAPVESDAEADAKTPGEKPRITAHVDGVKAGPLNILVVEDNPDIRITLRDLLELFGHTVEEASDGVKGVELVLERKPNVALVDIGLPGIDGYRLAELVRAAAGGNTTRLVALTGYGGPEDKKKALAAGFDAHLVKPVTAAELSKILGELS